MPNYNGVPLTSFVSKVFNMSIFAHSQHPITPLPFRETFEATTHPTINAAGFAPGRVHALETVRLVSVVPFSLHPLLGEFDKKVSPKENQNRENWRLKMNEPRKVNSFWPWKGIIWKGTLHTTTILQGLCSSSGKSMSSNLESEWGLRFLKETQISDQFRMNSTLLSRGHSFTELKPFHQQGSLLDSGNGLSVDHLIL